MVSVKGFVTLGGGMLFFMVNGWQTSSRSTADQATAVKETLVFDRLTREKAAKLKLSEIQAFAFYGPDFARFENDPIVVRDKKDLASYISALRHAYCRRLDQGNRVDTLRIDFLASKGRKLTPQYFHFALTQELDCYGPEFHKAMLALRARTQSEGKTPVPHASQKRR